MNKKLFDAAAQDEYMQQAQLREAALVQRVASLESILGSVAAAHAADHHIGTDRGQINHQTSDPRLRYVVK